METVTQLGVRIPDAAKSELASGRETTACTRAVETWIVPLRKGIALEYPQSVAARAELERGDDHLASRLVALLDEDLAVDRRFIDAVESVVDSYT